MMPAFELVFWHWFVLAAVLGTVEILAPGIFFLWLALAAFVTGAVTMLVPALNEATQITLFGALAVVLVFIAWRFVRRNPIASDRPLLNQRSAQYVGKTFTLVNAIKGGTGRVKIGDSTWKVEGTDTATGSQVKVIGYDGPTLKVEVVSGPAEDGPVAAPVKDEDSLSASLRDPLSKN